MYNFSLQITWHIAEVEKLSVLYTLHSFGLMVILGKEERDKFEMQRELFSPYSTNFKTELLQ